MMNSKLMSNFERIVVLQSMIRGYLARKRFKLIRYLKEKEYRIEQITNRYTEEIEKSLKYQNLNLKTFVFRQNDYEIVLKNRMIQKEMIKEMKNIDFADFGDYVGEYDIESLKRQGIGLQIDNDEIYIGEFARNRKEGKGRILNNQFYFEGSFINNRAEGHGLLHHYDK